MDTHLVVAIVRAAAIDRQIEGLAALFSPPAQAGAAPYAFELCVLDTASADQWHTRLALLDQAGTIVLPAWPARRAAPAPLLDAMRAAHERGARLCAIGSGLFALAATGLLDGKRVAAAPDDADRLLRRHPELHIKSGALFIDAGQLLSAASQDDGLAMLLHLVRRDHGPAIADLAAQRLATVAPHAAPQDDRFGQLLSWLRAHPAQPHTVASMAAQAGTDDASLQRHFMEKTGMAAMDWLRQARLALLGSLLETPPSDKERNKRQH